MRERKVMCFTSQFLRLEFQERFSSFRPLSLIKGMPIELVGTGVWHSMSPRIIPRRMVFHHFGSVLALFWGTSGSPKAHNHLVLQPGNRGQRG